MAKTIYQLFLLATFCFLLISCGPKSRTGDPKVLVFSKTAGFRHSSIEDGVAALQKLGSEKGFEVEATEDASIFKEEKLREFSTIIFLNTTGDILDTRQEAAFERYIQAGGGFVGIHAATDTEYGWKWYGELVGAYFKSHPRIQEADLIIHEDPKFPVLKELPEEWSREDEWYNFIKVPDHVNRLVSIDETSYEGGQNDGDHPMVWYHDYDGGRSFYIEFGHTSESYEEKEFLDLLYSGIEYAIGDNLELDYSDVRTQFAPDMNRFSKVILGRGLDEPTEITILPNKEILISERKGGLKKYNPDENRIEDLTHIEVYYETDTPNVNVETGFMGIKADPNYAENHWVYIFYSPTDVSVDRLSRFKYVDGVWDESSEQVILDVKTDRDICCHTGGSIDFDAKGNLYVSTGDNSTPFNQKDKVTGETLPINLFGFAPLDDRPGKEQYDGRRAPGNTNDLRGKILRIKVNDDGSYDIPEGNLFEEGNDKARPEIYVMGNRNPYRISVDQKTGYLYWGEVGPDSRNDSLDTRGPRGYDEINQARSAGNFGWPYFIGDNFAYWQYDYNTGESELKFDPEKPVNNSRNNTGMTELPPAQPAFIYYPYAKSKYFPNVGSGGRTAMAGPVYYPEKYPAETRLADYYDGKLFIYEWIRNWIKVVTMNEEGDLMRIEPFMAETDFVSISDMEFGPDGKLYLIEYGSGWFSKNSNSSLSVIEYNAGNRAPIPDLKIDRTAGQLPLAIQLDASGSSEPDGDPMTYTWMVDGEELETTQEPRYTANLADAGQHNIFVQVNDDKGSSVESQHYHVVAGNDRPDVTIEFEGNSEFYFDNSPVKYRVLVADSEDGSLASGDISTDQVLVEKDYIGSYDEASTTIGHQEFTDPEVEVQGIISGLDCASCHKKDEKSVGPAYLQISDKYKGNPEAEEYLSNKVIEGGSGVWGEVAMAAHPDVPLQDVKKIIQWIIGLADADEPLASLPVSGTIYPSSDFKLTEDGVVVLSASYKDKGAEGASSLMGQKTVYLSRPILSAFRAQSMEGATKDVYEETELALIEGGSAAIEFGKVDLTDVKKVRVLFASVDESSNGWEIKVIGDGSTLVSGNIGARSAARKPSDKTLRLDERNLGTVNNLNIEITRAGNEDSGLAFIGLELLK
ncbi:ThuA domain-containing protein [Membranihabitans maritimus]|uniref:ThuA domain-containing protein n=1 Tax=Membranihabitans maritimus TaxID=2904244 RepID=UPI001F4238A1|nr:ThuA domain-containing protein [Membranihabitans maritimus]